MSANPIQTFTNINGLLQEGHEAARCVTQSLRRGLPVALVVLSALGLSCVGLLLGSCYHVYQEAQFISQLRSQCTHEPQMCHQHFETVQTPQPKHSTALVDVAVRAVTYTLVSGSVGALCYAAVASLRAFSRLRRWVATLKAAPQGCGWRAHLLKHLQHDPLLWLVLASLATMGLVFTFCPPLVVLGVMPFLWDRFALVISVSALVAITWILGGWCALRVSITFVETMLSEDGPVWWFHISITSGRKTWTVKRRHRDFYALYEDLLPYEAARGYAVPRLGTKTMKDRACRVNGPEGYQLGDATRIAFFKLGQLLSPSLFRHNLTRSDVDIRRLQLQSWLREVVSHPDLGAPYNIPSLSIFLREGDSERWETACGSQLAALGGEASGTEWVIVS